MLTSVAKSVVLLSKHTDLSHTIIPNPITFLLGRTFKVLPHITPYIVCIFANYRIYKMITRIILSLNRAVLYLSNSRQHRVV